MKKSVSILVLVLFFWNLFLFAIISAQEPELGDGSEVEEIQQKIDEYVPIDDDGQFDPSKYKSKAEERIEKINEYIGPITKFLWGVELSLSWIFIFSFIVWILLIELIVMPVSEILDFNVWGSLFAAFIIATLAMQGFGQDLVAWMDSIATQWWTGLIVLGFAIAFGIIYSVIMKLFGKRIDKWKKERDEEKRKRDEKTLHSASEVAKKEFLEPEKFSYQQGMRRGGSNSRSGRFVSRKSTERYSKMFGDEQAKKRFDQSNP